MKKAPAAEQRKTSARRRVPLLLLLFLFLTTMIAPPVIAPLTPRSDALLFAEAVPLDASNPRRNRVGRLQFRRGWSFSSTQRGFGGISSMHVGQGRVIALNDAAIALEWDLPERTGRARLRLWPVSGNGAAKSGRDSEAMIVRGDRAWVAFERMNRVARFRLPGWRLEASARPAAMADWPGNSGAEAMVRLENGRFLIFGEGLDDGDPTSPLLLFDDDPAQPAARASKRRFKPPPDYRVTDAAELPDGGLLVLTRRFDVLQGVAAKLILVSPASLAQAIVEGEEIADLRPPLSIDNMEALSVEVQGGKTIVRIASDDNFVEFQRTLLLEFVLLERPHRKDKAKSPPARARGDR